jgi:EAL domain-containing protein (putative c-di-GMP-specific phosphodiesterase class I)
MSSNTDDEHGRVIVRTILAMANSLDYETVAEGVETEEQYTFLTHHGCTSVQGYLFTRPLPVRDFVDWFAGWAKHENQLTTNQRRKSA